MLDFLGIGAQKAGTTWLYEMLKLHPEVLFPGGKEVHYWNKLIKEKSHGPYDLNIKSCTVDYKSLFAPREDVKKLGEITPGYAILPCDVIKDIAVAYPNLRIIYIIRNPKERAWSSALMALFRSEMSIEEASDQWFVDHFQSNGSLARGDYERCIKNWLQVFPCDQFLVEKFDLITERPMKLLSQCAVHINIEPGFFYSLQYSVLNRKVFAGKNIPLRPSLAPVLEELYSTKIESLGKFMGWDLRSWL